MVSIAMSVCVTCDGCLFYLICIWWHVWCNDYYQFWVWPTDRQKNTVEFVFRLRGTSHTTHPAANTQWHLDFSPHGDVDGKQKVNNQSSPSKLDIAVEKNETSRWSGLGCITLQMGGIWKINRPRESIELMAASLIRPGLGRKWKPIFNSGAHACELIPTDDVALSPFSCRFKSLFVLC